MDNSNFGFLKNYSNDSYSFTYTYNNIKVNIANEELAKINAKINNNANNNIENNNPNNANNIENNNPNNANNIENNTDNNNPNTINRNNENIPATTEKRQGMIVENEAPNSEIRQIPDQLSKYAKITVFISIH